MVATSFDLPQGRKRSRTVKPDKPRVSTKKAAILEYLKAGTSIKEACERAGTTYESFRYYRRTDGQFASMVASITGEQKSQDVAERKDVPDFPEFCEEYLGLKMWPHQLQWFDLLEGREPRDIHPSMTFEPGDPDLLVINTPPGHAKSQTITIAYATWRIVKDPTVKVVIVSKTLRLASQFLLVIKNYLTHPAYQKMQDAFGPPGGFAQDSASWKQDLIYVSSTLRNDNEKDPTVQAIGIGGQLYGARADLIIMDDTVDNSNAHDYDKQIHWIETEVGSRIPDGGKLVVVGTRLAAKDLYSELIDPKRYAEGIKWESVSTPLDDLATPWTYFAQPAVLEFAEDPEDWVTLWPLCDRPSGKHIRPNKDGHYVKWDGPVLKRRRSRMAPAAWNRVYMQLAQGDDTIFDKDHINRSIKGYSPGLLADSNFARPGGMAGLYVLAGLDPSASNFTALTVYAVDIKTRHRWVLEVHNKKAMRPEAMKQLIRDTIVKFGVRELRAEQNAFQKFLVADYELTQFAASHGCTIVGHVTGSNKNDEELGVAAMEALFRNDLISLPRMQTEGVRALVDQLVVWDPDLARKRKILTDCVMSLWFAELRALELVQTASATNAFSRKTHFNTRGDLRNRRLVSTNGEVIPIKQWRMSG